MKLKRLLILLLAALMLEAALTGCAGTGPSDAQAGQTTPVQPSAAQPPAGQPQQAQTQDADSSLADSQETRSQEAAGESYIFTDSTGREVELPRNIERITPSGPLAQIVLYTLVPDKLVGLAADLTEEQLQYMDDRFRSLPTFGHFDAGTFNLESVMLAAPQVVIDIGQSSPAMADDMQGIQDRSGIPTIFIQLDDIDTMISGYAILGALFGAEEQAQKIIDYISEKIIGVIERAAAIPEADRVSVYYGQNDGLTALIAGAIHTDVIDFAGGHNVADIEQTIRGGAAEISMEQLMLWNPDVILFVPESVYGEVGSLPEWSRLNAVRDSRVYEVPSGPYNWMGRPPSVNRLVGVRWLANLLYPDIFSFDMAQETRDFYKLFYHTDVTDAQLSELLGKSTFK